jgi:hypothetical protein
MSYKEIICLANSRKQLNRCFAGKEVSSKSWIRPVSDHDKGAIATTEMDLGNGVLPQLFDIIRIPLQNNIPSFYQPENVLIDSQRWEKVGVFPYEKIDILQDKPDSIWANEPYLDRIKVSDLQVSPIGSSLMLIKPEEISLKKNDRNRIRANFCFNGIKYNLGVTDISIEKRFQEENLDSLSFEGQQVYLCISLGEPYERGSGMEVCCYKLVASVIYFPQAKSFIDKIKSYCVDEIRKVYPKAYMKWSETEDADLRLQFRSGKTIEELADIFKRKKGAIRSRLIKLGLLDE